MIARIVNSIGRRLKKQSDAVQLPPDLKIGTDCVIMSNISFGSEPYLISIGNKVRIADDVRFFTHDGGAWVLRNMGLLPDADFFGQISVGDNVHIGAQAIIMPGVSIGSNCIVGVRSIVTKDVPDNTVVAGIPARVICTIEEYHEKHKGTCDYTKHMNREEKKEYLKKKFGL